ncbi:MAG TPA: class I SAM-dependent methyltransferase [Methylophilaceae bacterium]
MIQMLEFRRRHGARRLASCIYCKLLYRALQQIYRFDPWHASAPFACREYKVRAVDLASSTHSRVVLDIGCGLGDIIGRVRAEKRWGVDKSTAAIAAARRLFGGRVCFAIGSLFAPDEIANVVPDRPIDLVIITNWAHGVELEQLIVIIRSIQQKLSVRMLLIDTVRPGILEGCFAHSIDDLARLGEVKSSVDCGDGTRDLHLIALTP